MSSSPSTSLWISNSCPFPAVACAVCVGVDVFVGVLVLQIVVLLLLLLGHAHRVGDLEHDLFVKAVRHCHSYVACVSERSTCVSFFAVAGEMRWALLRYEAAARSP